MQIFLYMGIAGKQLTTLASKKSPGMLPVLDRPLINRVISTVARQGFSRLLVALELLPEQIESYLRDGRRWNVELDYILLPRRLGDGGALKWSQSKLDGPCVVMAADMLLEVDLSTLIKQHEESGCVATVLAHTMGYDRPVYSAGDSRLASPARGVPCGSAAGVFVVNPSVLDYIPHQCNFDIYNDLLPALLAARQPVGIVETSAYWNPLSTYCDFHKAQQDFLNSLETPAGQRAALDLPTHPELHATRYAEGIWVGPDNTIHPEALLTPPVYIGPRCHIGKGVELGPHAYIGSDVVVDAAATIRNSIVLDKTYVGELINVEGYIVDGRRVIDSHSGEELAVTDDFLIAKLDGERVYRDLGRPVEAAIALLLLGLVSPLLLPVMLLQFLMTGRVFQPYSCVVALDEVEGGRDQEVRLLRLATRRPDGSAGFIGRCLEAWELFRLPELWNVARGDIQLIGLTPLTMQEAATVEPFWRKSRRGKMAGFIGLWYVQAEATGDLDERMAADAFYVATYDRWQELSLLLQSPVAWRRRINANQQESRAYT